MGIRALHTEGDDVFDAVAGDLDAAGKGATILADHSGGGRAASRHVRFSLPLAAGGGAVRVDTVHAFGEIKRVEGIAMAPDGHAHYVIDEEGHVALRTLLLE
jgi:2,3-bisphosphoglycerate-independent phosphoglycerate mutase